MDAFNWIFQTVDSENEDEDEFNDYNQDSTGKTVSKHTINIPIISITISIIINKAINITTTVAIAIAIKFTAITTTT